MAYFEAKIHKIRFRLGLRPRSRWESLQRSPDLLAGFQGPASKGNGGEGTDEDMRAAKIGERREKKEGM